MIVPGSNLLNIALGVIAGQDVTLYRFTGRTTNAIGYDIASYAAGVPLTGSMQPVARNLYQTLGLDFRKNYATLYASADVQDVTRDGSGDQFGWNGRRWQAESNTDWLAVDGWKGVLLVDVGADT